MLWLNILGWVSCALVKGRSPENVCGGGESELGQVMLAYTEFVFFPQILSFLNLCDLMLFLLVLEFMHVCVFVF